jgi:hypothetical protein
MLPARRDPALLARCGHRRCVLDIGHGPEALCRAAAQNNARRASRRSISGRFSQPHTQGAAVAKRKHAMLISNI